jgi:hypothetical protein
VHNTAINVLGARVAADAVLPKLRGTGVHATSITITASTGSAPRFEPAEIANAYLELDQQPETEWQPELVY